MVARFSNVIHFASGGITRLALFVTVAPPTVARTSSRVLLNFMPIDSELSLGLKPSDVNRVTLALSRFGDREIDRNEQTGVTLYDL